MYTSVGSKFRVWKNTRGLRRRCFFWRGRGRAHQTPRISPTYFVFPYRLSDHYVKKMLYYLSHIFSLTHMFASRTRIFVEPSDLIWYPVCPRKGAEHTSYKSKHFMTSHQLYQESERAGTRYHNSLRRRNLQCFQKLPSLTLLSPALFTLFFASILLILLSNSDHLIQLKAQWVTGIWDRTWRPVKRFVSACRLHVIIVLRNSPLWTYVCWMF